MEEQAAPDAPPATPVVPAPNPDPVPEVAAAPKTTEPSAPTKEPRTASRVFRDKEGKYSHDPQLLEQLSKSKFEQGKLVARIDQMQKQDETKMAPVSAGVDREMLAAVQRATTEASAAARELEEFKRTAASQMDLASSKITASEEELQRKLLELNDMKSELAKSREERNALETENKEHRKRTREQLEMHKEQILEYIREVAGVKDCAMEQRVMDAISAGDRNPEVSFMVAASAKHSTDQRDSKKMRTEYDDLRKKWENMSGELQERRAAAPPLQTPSSRFAPEKPEAPPSSRINVGGHTLPESMSTGLWDSMRTIVPSV